MRSLKSNENIHKKEDGSYYVVSANKASSVTLQSPDNESQRKHFANFQINKGLSRIWILTNHLFLISHKILADLQVPK